MTKRILVVEDQEDNRRILARSADDGRLRDLLRPRTVPAASPPPRPSGPDLILMDIQLPIMDGYEATRRIKANPDLMAIPIIVVTSYALSGDEDKARAAGCDDYITKPYSPRALLAKIKEHLH